MAHNLILVEVDGKHQFVGDSLYLLEWLLSKRQERTSVSDDVEERTFFHCWYQLKLQPLWDCSVPSCFLKVSSFYSQQSASVLSSELKAIDVPQPLPKYV